MAQGISSSLQTGGALPTPAVSAPSTGVSEAQPLTWDNSSGPGASQRGVGEDFSSASPSLSQGTPGGEDPMKLLEGLLKNAGGAPGMRGGGAPATGGGAPAGGGQPSAGGTEDQLEKLLKALLQAVQQNQQSGGCGGDQNSPTKGAPMNSPIGA